MGNSIDREKVIRGLEDTAEYFRHLQTVGYFGDQPIFLEHETHCNNAIALLKEQEAREKNRLPYSPDSNVQWT